MSATASEQFMPLRSLMYFFIFATTIRMSRSTTSASFTPSTAAALACEASPTTRRTGALPGDDAGAGVGAALGGAAGRGEALATGAGIAGRGGAELAAGVGAG